MKLSSPVAHEPLHAASGSLREYKTAAGLGCLHLQRARSVASQSAYRESGAQTEPYAPAGAPAVPSAKQQALSRTHHCPGPEARPMQMLTSQAYHAQTLQSWLANCRQALCRAHHWPQARPAPSAAVSPSPQKHIKHAPRQAAGDARCVWLSISAAGQAGACLQGGTSLKTHSRRSGAPGHAPLLANGLITCS